MKTLKVIVGGEGQVGKTSLIRHYVRGTFSEARNVTPGIDITTQELQIDGESVRLAIWDINGQVGNRPNFYRGAQAAMLVYDATEPSSLEALAEWHAQLTRYGGDAPVIVGCNKIDLGLAFPQEWGRVFAKTVGARHGFVSATTGENVAQAFDLLAREATSHADLARR